MRCGRSWLAVAIGVCLICLATGAGMAQTKTTATHTQDFEIVSIDGNNLVVRGAEGTKEITVPEDFRFDYHGKQLSVGELKPGMKGKATITTTTTVHPVKVTEVKKGRVKQVSGSWVIVQTDKGYQKFSEGDMEHRNVTIFRDGQPVKLSDLNVGENLSATIVTEGPPQVLTEREVKASLASGGTTVAPVPHAPSSTAAATTHLAPPPAATESTSTPAPAAEEASAAKPDLPTTASPLPLIGLVGLVALALGIALRLRRLRA
jgi:hypothetical protein